MRAPPFWKKLGGASILAAALALLQPGFDPVFLTILSAAHGTGLTHHGWVVGATQSGMALGSLVVLQSGSRLPQAILPLAAFCACLASLATAGASDIILLLAIRALYGTAMGIIYIQVMSDAAATRPNGAYGAVFLTQLVIATLVALLLPAIAASTQPRIALATLAIVPAICLTLILSGAATRRPAAIPVPPESEEGEWSDAAGWALATASLLFICTTMMVWSFTGALAMTAHISETVIGRAVAIGSIVGAATALFVMREQPFLPLPLTGLMSGLSLLSPIIATAIGGDGLFILSVVLLNIGSTAIIIRCSGMATARARCIRFRRIVAATHSLGMILGPVAGSLLTSAWGTIGLVVGALLTLMSGCIALLLAAAWTRPFLPIPARKHGGRTPA
ncbi:hypothetical protein BH10PSE13_BH10PSE13_10940 [soil metagenome]